MSSPATPFTLGRPPTRSQMQQQNASPAGTPGPASRGSLPPVGGPGARPPNGMHLPMGRPPQGVNGYGTPQQQNGNAYRPSALGRGPIALSSTPAPIPPPLPSNLSASEKGKEREDPVKNERSDSLDMTDGVVDLRAEEEAQRYQSTFSRPSTATRATPKDVDRHKKQSFIDPAWLKERVSKIATNEYKLLIEDEALTYLALAAETRVRDLLTSMISAKTHRLTSHHARPPPLYPPNPPNPPNDPSSSASSSTGQAGAPMWSETITSDPNKWATTIERVEKEEEGRRRRERMKRDEEERRRIEMGELLEEEEEIRRLEAIAAGIAAGQQGIAVTAAAGEEGMEGVEGGSSSMGVGGEGTADGAGGGPTDTSSSTAAGQKAKKPKPNPSNDSSTPLNPSNPSSTSGTPAPSFSSTTTAKKPGATLSAKNMSEQTQKKLSNSAAMQAAGINRKSWMFGGGLGGGGGGSPSPAARMASKAAMAAGASGLSQSTLPGEGNSAGPLSTPLNNATPAAASTSSWSRPFQSHTTSTPSHPALAPPSSSLFPNPTPSTPNNANTPSSFSTASTSAFAPSLHPASEGPMDVVTLADALFVLERERGHGAGKMGSARRLVGKAFAVPGQGGISGIGGAGLGGLKRKEMG